LRSCCLCGFWNPLRLSHHGSGRLCRFRDPERTASAGCGANCRGGTHSHLHCDGLSGLSSGSDTARRRVAIRRKRYWYEGFLGFRYLRASPHRGFVSLIAGIAIVGLALGVAVLIIVLSVMNGFEEVLRTRILSLTAHATISGIEGRIPNWRGAIAKMGA